MGFGTFNMGTLQVDATSTHLMPDESSASVSTIALTEGGTPEECIPADVTATKGRKVWIKNESSETIFIGLSSMASASDSLYPIAPDNMIYDEVGQGQYNFVAATAGTEITVGIIPYVEV